MPPSQARPDRILILILAGIAVLVAVALVVVFTRGEPPLRDAGTPEGVVQRYTAAVIDGDEAAAAGYLSQGALARCNDTGSFGRDGTAADDIRVTLVSATVRADTADVRVYISTSYDGGPFGGSETTTDEVFDLVKVDGSWLVNNAAWMLMVCPSQKVTS